MNRTILTAAISMLGVMSFGAGCESDTPKSQVANAQTHDHAPVSGGVAVAKLSPSKSATTQPSNNNVSGTVTFTNEPDGSVKIVADVSGLVPGTKHGFHIHEKGDLGAPDLMSAGGHYNPDHHIHGGPTTSPVHAGDFGNLVADDSGHAHLELSVRDISIGGDHNDILGKAVIVHGGTDDLSSQPAGNSGPRIAGGIIELKK